MDPKERTLSALSTYVASQRVLLTRMKSDLERLKELKASVEKDPEEVLNNLYDRLGGGGFSISSDAKELDDARRVPDIDWSLFHHRDPDPFHDISVHASRRFIREEPLPEPSALQLLVRSSAATMLSSFRSLSPSLCDEGTTPISPSTSNLDKRLTLKTSTSLPTTLKTPILDSPSEPRRTTRVHKPKVMDGGAEEAEVIRTCGLRLRASERNLKKKPKERAASVARSVSSVQSASTSARRRASTPAPHPVLKIKLPPLLDHQRYAIPDSPSPSASTSLASPPPQEETNDVAPVVSDFVVPKGLPQRPDTYKQAWTHEEQHILERLLAEIPEGAKNRWAKISQGMMGRRTPRQVASRVQKYFAKLKKFGVPDPGS
ncbi:hypothetical protein SISNIDRAFT_450789 [Sistotremastrum niveocremeum HHB9708]|uniref:Uncharacterized protein n=1 Tax=Sistotremastrum niveocremeum HHB9708 TaxID=1314777 RepID=A0A164YK64_9AGAM|nr:hypothetical protein SISNIDRAFT_450789 [Sistotremastrum niveocremeum HHB9708]